MQISCFRSMVRIWRTRIIVSFCWNSRRTRPFSTRKTATSCPLICGELHFFLNLINIYDESIIVFERAVLTEMLVGRFIHKIKNKNIIFWGLEKWVLRRMMRQSWFRTTTRAWAWLPSRSLPTIGMLWAMSWFRRDKEVQIHIWEWHSMNKCTTCVSTAILFGFLFI